MGSNRRYKIVVSDFHLGFGLHDADGERNLLEDFFCDLQFVELLQYYSKGDYAKAEVELVLNGDFLNHLHAHPDEPFADSLSERVSLERTEKIIAGHSAVFAALKEFLAASNHTMIYLMGNHDLGVAWPKVQQLLKDQIGNKLRIELDPYQTDGIHIEHGNRFSSDSRLDTEDLFVTRGQPEPVLKMPWGCFFVIHFINRIRRERPYVGRIYPFNLYLRWALFHDTRFALRTIYQMLAYFLKMNFIRDPRRNFRLRDTWKIAGSYQFPERLDREAKKILMEHKEIKVVLLAHTHQALYRQFALGKEYLNSGTWDELISLDVASMGKSHRLTFVEVAIEGNTVRPALREWKGAYREVEEVMF